MKHLHKKFSEKINLFRCIFPLIVLLFFVLPISAQTLTSNGDTHAVTPGSSPNDAGGQITLRSALEAATAQAGTHTITIPLSITNINLTLGQITVGPSSPGTANITVNGPGKAILTINQTTATRVFITGTGAITFVLTDLTLNYNGPATSYGGGGGAIQSGGIGATTTLTNVAITNFTQTTSGGALLCTTASASNNLTLTNCDFTNNTSSTTGGAIEYNGNGTCNISNCKFSGNQVANSGGDGGAITITGSGIGGTISITKCTFTGNKVLNTTSSGGAIANGNGALTANYNRFTGNTAATATNGNTIAELATSTINADNNWWGVNTGPTANDKAAGSGTITVTKWLQLKTTASPTSICGGGSTATFTASYLLNSASEAVSTGNLVPEIGLPITFTNAVLGTLSGAQTTIQATGTATVTYTSVSGSTGGTGSVNAVVDNIPSNDVAPAKGTITVNQPGVTNPGVTTGTNGTAFSQTFTQTGAIGGATFTVNGTLPTGLSLSTAGVLSGTPTQSGTFPITVTVTGGNSCTGTGPTYNLTINPGVCPTITVTNPGVTTGTNGTPFSQTFTESGAVGGATFTLNSGTLPTGLTLSTGGVLSGTPIQSGSFPITVQVTDGNGCVGDGGTYNLVINGGAGASSPGDYFRTITTGNWNNVNTWESSPVSDFSSGLVSPATLTPDFNASAVNIRSTHTVTVTANVTTDNTFVNPGGTLAVAASTTLTINNNGLTVQSTSSGTGSIGNSAGIIDGNVIVQRYISSQNNRAYRLLGPSVNTSTTIFTNWQEGGTNPGNTKVYTTTLTGSNESPPNASPATGTVTITIDNGASTMRVQCTFSGLTGTSTAAHLHAATTAAGTGNALVATTSPSFAGFPSGVTSGTYDNILDMTQASSYNPAYVTANGGTTASAFSALKAALDNGTSYFDIHTSTFPGGEIRGFPGVVSGFGTQITGSTTGANGFDATQTGQGSLFIYDQVTPAWTGIANTNATNLDAKTGYLLYIRGDRSIDLTSQSSPLPSTNTTLRATGTLLQGTQNFSGLADNDFSLVTNPFASAINWSSIYTNNSASFNNYYTYWDPNIGTRGGYVTVTDGGVVNPSVSGGTALGTINIQSGQAFFVNSTTSSPTLTIQESDKSTPNNIDVFRTATPAAEKFTVSLYFNDPEHGRRLADGVTALYDNSYNAAVDRNDAIEISNFDENIAIARGGKHLSIEERPLITTKDTLQLFMNNMKQQGYEFEFNPTNLDPNTVAQLVDNFTGNKTILNIASTTVVPFTITSDPASNASDRFYIMFSPSGALPVTLTSVKAYQKNAGVQVEWTTQQESNMDHYEVERSQDGQQFTSIGSVKAKGNSNVVLNYSFFDANPFNGVNFYRIRSVDINGKASYSVIVTVNISGGSGSRVIVYPNPVHNTLILQLSNLDKGSYTISLTNKLGQQILSKVIDHPGGSATQSIDLSKTMSAGAYQLRITGNGISITQQVIKN